MLERELEMITAIPSITNRSNQPLRICSNFVSREQLEEMLKHTEANLDWLIAQLAG